MKKYIIKIFTIISISFIATSCDAYLELQPQDSLIQDEFWQTKDHVKSALAGAYASMNQSSYTDRALFWGELRGELLTAFNASTAEQNLIDNFNIPTSTYSNWASFYTTINHCNLVLDFADEVQTKDQSFTDEELKSYKGQARAIRSLSYFILLKTFKEVPLVLVGTSNNEVPFYIAKSSEQEILVQIINDLKQSVEDLPIGFSQSLAHDRGQINKGSAMTILADVYLWANQYNECIDICNDIYALNKYSLVDGSDWFNDIFLLGNSSEGIFELQFETYNNTYRNKFYHLTPSFRPLGDVKAIYEDYPNDVRGDNASYNTVSNVVFKFSGLDPITSTFRNNDEYYNNFIFYRYAEVLLMQAEAYIFSADRSNFPEALSLMNQVHFRATGTELVTSLDIQSLSEELLIQRKKEFAFEGKRWFDLLRFDRRDNFAGNLILNMAETKTTLFNYEEILSNFTDPESYFLPIYENELNLNRNLEQNEFYINY